ncbi:uncharacterized protein LOC144445592 isoform X2 [Glandiceps talaboti]
MMAVVNCIIRIIVFVLSYNVNYTKATNGDFQVRLIDGMTPFEGRVEVFINDTWWIICHGDQEASDVICQELGFSESSMRMPERTGSRKGNALLIEVTCNATQQLLRNCLFSPNNNCRDMDFLVSCSIPSSPGTCHSQDVNNEGWIFSPKFPENYDDWADCTWIVTSTHNNSRFDVTLRMLYLGTGFIWGDFVEFNDLEGKPNPYRLTRGSKLKGVLMHHVGVTKSNRLRVHFESSAFNNDKGFAVFYTDFSTGVCSTATQCLHGGTCYQVDDVDTCECSQGWKGETCDVEITVCQNVTCFNNGTCNYIVIGGNDTYFCSCPDNYGGEHCEKGNCTDKVCLNGGNCYKVKENETCECPEDWTGDTCDDLTVCQNVTCQNNGTCHSAGGNDTYFCNCSKSYEGKHCEEGIDDRSSSTTEVDLGLEDLNRERRIGSKEIGGIVGGVVVVVVAAVVAIIIAVIFYKRRTKKSRTQEASWERGQSVHLRNVTYDEHAVNTGLAATNREDNADGTYYSSIDKSGDNVYNEPDEVKGLRRSPTQSRENGSDVRESKMNKQSGNLTEGSVDNIAYESMDQTSSETSPEESGFVDNIVYEGGENVPQDANIYEESDLRENQEGFVDNIVYESND